MATSEFELPKIGEGITEAEITRWLVAVGDSVAMDQPLVEVMTDKATVEIPSPFAGSVKELKAAVGDVVPVGGTLLVYQSNKVAGVSSASQPVRSEQPARSEITTTFGQAEPASRPAVQQYAQPIEPQPSSLELSARLVASTPPARALTGGLVLAAPATRRRARELGVDLATLQGSGRHGRVIPADVEAAAATSSGATGRGVAAAAPAASAPAGGTVPGPRARPAGSREIEIVRISGIRKKISEAMVRSKFTAPHFTYVDEFDASALLAMRNELKDQAAERGVKLTYLPFFFKALVPALRQFPRINANMHEPEGAPAELQIKRYYNFGISVATDNGLIVPVVRDVDQLTLFEVASELQRVSAEARSGRPRLSDLNDSSFTVTSAGNIGGLFATPIINYPDVAILGVHVIKPRAVVGQDGTIVARPMSYISMSLDHRVVDGADAAHFVNLLISYLEHPARLLLDAI
jgi:pyruvate dehydrogenase E2 component (dihydrolipoamide acetyltransferase)